MWRYVLAALATAVILLAIKAIHVGGVLSHVGNLGNLGDIGDLAGLDAVDSSFHWTGPVKPGQWTTIRSIAGGITVVPSSDSLVHVAAVKRWKAGSPVEARVLTQESDSGLVVCVALAGDSDCTDLTTRRARSRRNANRRGAVAMDFTVRVPARVKVDAQTIVGNIALDSTREAVRARTVSGRVRLTALGGPVSANVVNGSIVANLDSAAARNSVTLETVNGSVTARMPAGFTGSVVMHTVNGAVGSEFPVTSTGEQQRHRLEGTVGSGGSLVRLSSVNGSVHLRKLTGMRGLDAAADSADGG